jgi:hypothetical protein
MTKNYSGRVSSHSKGGFSRYRVCALLAALSVLQGCAMTLEFLKPTPVDFERMRDGPFYKDHCISAPKQVVVPLGGGASMEVNAEMATFTGKRFSETPGTTLFGEIYVPAGSEVRFLNATFTAADGTGKEHSGAIVEIERRISYGPKRDGEPTSTVRQTLSGTDLLAGWTEKDKRSSGLVPEMNYIHGDSHNYFHFYVPWENFNAPAFTVRMPDMVVNGSPVSGKSISFKRVREKVYGDPLCS